MSGTDAASDARESDDAAPDSASVLASPSDEQAHADYRLLATGADVVDYLRDRDLLDRVGDPDSVEVREVTAGNMNRVFIARGPAGSLAVKQAPPWVQVAGPGWPVDPGRIESEARAYEVLASLVPASVPGILSIDPDRFVMVMEDLSDLAVLRDRMVAEQLGDAAPLDYEELGRVVGRFAAELTFATSEAGLEREKRERLIETAANPELCAMTDAVVLDEPFREHEHNRPHPDLEPAVRAMYADADIQRAAADIRRLFATRTDALIHGDLHTGSLMVGIRDGAQAVKVFDPEFAFVGPAGMDIGLFWANLSISAVAARYAGRPALAEARLRCIGVSWVEFTRVVESLWPDRVAAPDGLDLGEWLERIRRDAWAFAGVEAMRRVAGYARAADLVALPPEVVGAANAEVFANAKRWMLERTDPAAPAILIDPPDTPSAPISPVPPAAAAFDAAANPAATAPGDPTTPARVHAHDQESR